jgi:succinate dehydrogenase (or fumarate reductase) cytochrome b subunit, b558 family
MKLFIIDSSIGRKLIMSLSGLFLFVFLTLHTFLNMLLLAGPATYQAGCEFMELPVVTVMVPILAAGFFIHIAYGIWLSWMNLRARGEVGYASGKKSQTTSWAARNMFVLGAIVLLFIALHLTHFWAKMQLQAFMGGAEQVHAEEAYGLVATLLRNPVYNLLYIAWYWVLWFHLTHGFWSAFQTIGVNNSKWQPRLQVIGIIYATILIACLTGINVYFLLGCGA